MKKDRGKSLTILLVLSFLITLFGTNAMFNSNIIQAYSQVGQGWFTYAIIKAAIALLAFYGIWKWKKWAVYLLVILSVADFIVNVVMMVVTTGLIDFAAWIALITGFFGAIVWIGLWGWAIYRKWKYFE